jgi:hypothetical protein
MENMELLKTMVAEINVNMNTKKEIMKKMINANQAKTKANLKDMREEIKSGQAEMRFIVNVWIADMKKDRKETMSCHVTTDACQDSKELNLEDVKFEVEHREVPMEETAVKSSRTMKKRHKGRHLVAGRRGEPNELPRGDCGSQRKLASACKKMSRRAEVARRKRKFFRKIRTQGNCGPQKKLAAASRKMPHCAKVAQCKGYGLQGRSHEGPSVEQGRRKIRPGINLQEEQGLTLGRRQLMPQEGNNGTRNRDFEEQLRLGSERTTSEAFGLEFVKQATRMSSGLRKMRNWILWRGRLSLKRKKRRHTE